MEPSAVMALGVLAFGAYAISRSGGDGGKNIKDILDEKGDAQSAANKERMREEVVDRLVEAGSTQSEAVAATVSDEDTRITAQEFFKATVPNAASVAFDMWDMTSIASLDPYSLYEQIVREISSDPKYIYNPNTGVLRFNTSVLPIEIPAMAEWNTVLPPAVTAQSSTQTYLVAIQGLEDVIDASTF